MRPDIDLLLSVGGRGKRRARLRTDWALRLLVRVMSENTSTPSTTPGDDARIDIDAEGQAEHWAREFRVSVDELRDAVRTVGDEVEKVREFLAGGGNRVP